MFEDLSLPNLFLSLELHGCNLGRRDSSISGNFFQKAMSVPLCVREGERERVGGLWKERYWEIVCFSMEMEPYFCR